MAKKLDRGQHERMMRMAQDAFANFKKKREQYDSLVHRDLEPVLDPRMGSETAKYKTPDLEEAEQDFMDILTMNPTRFAGNPGAEGTRAQSAMEDAVLIAARTWATENKGRWIDRSNAGGQARYGVNLMRMLHNPIEEPDVEGYKDRDEALADQPWPFYFEDAVVLGAAWLPVKGKHDFIVYEYEKAVVSGDEILVTGKQLNKGKKGKTYKDDAQYRAAVDSVGKLAWFGDDEVLDKSAWDKKLKGWIIEYRNPEKECPICTDKHAMWCGVEYLCADGEAFEDAEIIQEYTLPYKHAGTFRVVPGRTTGDADPHNHYRPLEFRLIVEATVMNWALSTLQTLANRDSSDTRVYLDITKTPDAVLERLTDEFWDTMKVDTPDVDKGQIPVLPGALVPWPAKMAEILWEVYQDAAKRFEAAKPNRFLTGENYDEAAQGTGTANLQSVQQAGIKFDWPLSQIDTFILEAKEDQFHAIQYWDYEGDPKTEQKWFVTLTAEETVKGITANAGERRYLSASKLEYAFDLVLVTSNETLQEQSEKQRQAFEQYDRGWIDDDQMLERLGYHDTKAQKRRIAKYQLKRDMADVKRTAQRAMLTTLMSAVAEIDPMLIAGQQAGMGAPGGQPPAMQQGPPPSTAPQPEIALPAIGGPMGNASPIGTGGMI